MKRRWFQFSIRAMFIVMLAVAMWLGGWKAAKLHTQREAERAERESAAAAKQALAASHAARISSLAFSAGGRLVTTSGNGAVKVWDASTGQQVSFGGENAMFSRDGYVLVSGADGSVRIWNAAGSK